MKVSILLLLTLAFSSAVLSGCTPTSAQTAPALDLNSKIGEMCNLRFLEDKDTVLIQGVLARVTDKWVVITQGQRLDVWGSKDKHEFWIQANSIKSVEFLKSGASAPK